MVWQGLNFHTFAQIFVGEWNLFILLLIWHTFSKFRVTCVLENEENLVDILRGNDADIKSRTQTPQNESETELLLESMTHGHFSYKLKVKWEEK